MRRQTHNRLRSGKRLSRTKANLAIAAFEMRWQATQPELERIFSPNKNSGATPLDVQPLHL